MLVGEPPHKHHPTDLRRSGCSPTNLETYHRADHVPFHIRLHLKNGWYRGWCYRAASYLLLLLRAAVLGSSPDAVCEDVGGKDLATQGERMALEHRLGWCWRHHWRQALPVGRQSFVPHLQPANLPLDLNIPELSSTQFTRENSRKRNTRHTTPSICTYLRPAAVYLTTYSTPRSHGLERQISRRKLRSWGLCSPRTSRSTPMRLPRRSSKLVSSSGHLHCTKLTYWNFQVRKYRENQRRVPVARSPGTKYGDLYNILAWIRLLLGWGGQCNFCSLQTCSIAETNTTIRKYNMFVFLYNISM